MCVCRFCGVTALDFIEAPKAKGGSMKRLLVMGLAFGLTTGAFAAQDKLSGAEADVQITQQPSATHVTGNQAILTWKTDSTAANNVLYRPVGSSEWKHEFIAKGSKDHWVKITGLQPNTKYEYQILTTSNKVRAAGQFETAAAGTTLSNSTSSSTSASSTPMTASPGNSGMVSNTSVGPHTQNGRVTLYRAVNSSNGAHTFTTSQSEVPSGFTMQGVAGYLVGKDVGNGTAPLYAMSHANGDYFYTTDANERQQAISAGWQDKGIIGYIGTSQQTGTIPMYRMDGPNGLHFYTADPNERSQAASAGWRDVGVVGYIWTK